MEYLPIGECKVYAGDPTVALGAGMIDLGLAGTVGISKTPLHTIVAPNGIEDADGFYSNGYLLGAQINLHDHATDIVAAVLPDVQKVVDSLAYGRAFSKIDPRTLCILPSWDLANGVDSDFAIWLPAYRPGAVGDETYNPSVNQGVTENPWQITVSAMRRTLDQASNTIPLTAAFGFRGKPDDHGLVGWTLP